MICVACVGGGSRGSTGFKTRGHTAPGPRRSAVLMEGERKVSNLATGATTDPGHASDDPSRRDFIHIAAIAAAAGGAAAVVWPFIDQMNPSADTLALASVEFDLGKVMEGQQVTIKWRGKPLFIRNRTPKEVAEAVKDDHAAMKDPATDASRVKAGKSQWLVLIGNCTHLGCVPTFGGGEYGGWFCPCHGSVYDTSGRIRKGPAPLNLVVPEYAFLSDTKVKIG
jgi:ubiquinol-cytochrome c reductase iron-sulfur subunit